MGFFDALIGNASQITTQSATEEIKHLLVDGEQVQMAYKSARDLHIFTNKRIVFVDKQGVTGSKVEWLSVPYRSVVRFALESAGTFDLDAELKIWVAGSPAPIEKKLSRDTPIPAIIRGLSSYVL